VGVTQPATQATGGSPQDDSAIRALVASYAYAVLTADTELWLSLWQDRDEPPSDDPLSLDLHWARKVAERWDALGTVVLHLSTHLIRHLAPERAEGRVFCLAELDRMQDGRRSFMEQTIIYEDDYVRGSAGWQFATRRHLLWYGRSKPNPREQPAANWPTSQIGRGVDLASELRPLPGG
jgi:hypothetical protein